MQALELNPTLQSSAGPSPVNPLKGSTYTEKGRPSIIHEYCLKADREGRNKCIWICMKKRNRWIAKDMCLEKEGLVLGMPELRMQCSWWRRHSLYSVVGVKEVMVISVSEKKISYYADKSSLVSMR